MPTANPASTPRHLFNEQCSSSNLRGPHGAAVFFSPRHMPGSYDKTFFESRKGFFGGIPVPGPPALSRIEYNATNSKWVLSSSFSKTEAFSLAKEETYVLGKHNWTVSNDDQQCHLGMGKAKHEEYSKELKLSSCNQGFRFAEYGGLLIGEIVLEEIGEFTCNNGQ